MARSTQTDSAVVETRPEAARVLSDCWASETTRGARTAKTSIAGSSLLDMADPPGTRASAALEAHADTRLGAERDVGCWDDVLARDERQSEALRDRGQNQDRFHHRECVAYALARTATEWKVGEARHAPGRVICPALRTERLWLIEPAWVTMHHPRRRDHDPAARHGAASHLGWSHGFPSEAVSRRKE